MVTTDLVCFKLAIERWKMLSHNTYLLKFSSLDWNMIILSTVLLELVHPTTINAMRMHLYTKLFDHHFTLNGGYTITALQKLPFLLKNSLFSVRLTMTLPCFCQHFLLQMEQCFIVTDRNSTNLHWLCLKGVITNRPNDWHLPVLINPMSKAILARNVLSS